MGERRSRDVERTGERRSCEARAGGRFVGDGIRAMRSLLPTLGAARSKDAIVIVGGSDRLVPTPSRSGLIGSLIEEE